MLYFPNWPTVPLMYDAQFANYLGKRRYILTHIHCSDYFVVK